jgi:cytochrome c oxidase assembly factor CtaG
VISSALAAAWSFDGWTLLALAISAFFYVRGMRVLRDEGSLHVSRARAGCFGLGLFALFVAVASPLDGLSEVSLLAHMIQHWLLMMVAPPLLWLGAPTVPILRGLPTGWLHGGVGPLLARPAMRRALRTLAHPAIATSLLALTLLVWHLPPMYELALRAPVWHDVEHASFFWSALLFWHPVIEPWPARRGERPMAVILQLLGFMLFSGVFSATFAFSSEVFYPTYAAAPRIGSMSALIDQQSAGAFMWLAGSLPMAIAAVVHVVDWLGPRDRRPRRPRVLQRWHSVDGGSHLAGARLRRLVARRRWLQRGMWVGAVAIVLDGFFGPQTPSGSNLAGVLPWTWWRPFVVLALILAGNLFCGVCPFISTRDLAGRLFGNRLVWPRAFHGPRALHGPQALHGPRALDRPRALDWKRVLGGRSVAAVLFVLYLWSYEVFGVWDSPFWTAWVIVGYFGAAFVIEGVFARGTFCRHVCPIGQFQFIGSAISPRTIGPADPAVCADCTTHDCVRGNAERAGCPTGLFIPTKSGGLDCTLCLDCAQACPHENVGWRPVARGQSIGVGRSLRSAPGLDLTAMSALFVFGAFVNAAAMVAPIESLRASLADRLPDVWAEAVFALVLALALTALPAMLVLGAAFASRRVAQSRLDWRAVAGRFVPSLIPLGVAMWLAHFGLHWLADPGGLILAAGRAFDDAVPGGVSSSGVAVPGASMSAPLYSPELWILAVGLVVSVAVGWRLARRTEPGRRVALRLVGPWALLAIALHLFGVWILVQPMAMRGMVM